MPKLSPVVSAERRLNIVNAARRCFASRGIAVSVEEICAEAGISKGAFYGYFSSKDAAIEAIAGEHRSVIDSLSTIDGLDALADRLFAYVHDGDPQSNRLELEAWTYSLQQPSLKMILQENLQHLGAALLQNDSFSLDTISKTGSPKPPTALILQVFVTGLVATIALTDNESNARNKHDLREALRYLLDHLITR